MLVYFKVIVDCPYTNGWWARIQTIFTTYIFSITVNMCVAFRCVPSFTQNLLMSRSRRHEHRNQGLALRCVVVSFCPPKVGWSHVPWRRKKTCFALHLIGPQETRESEVRWRLKLIIFNRRYPPGNESLHRYIFTELFTYCIRLHIHTHSNVHAKNKM